MAFEKKHTRDYFYKYTSARTAKKILQNLKLRWSNPRLFNDPFDCQAGFHWDLDIEQLPNLAMARMEELFRSKESLVFVEKSNLTEAIEAVREASKTNIFLSERFMEKVAPFLQTFKEWMKSERIKYLGMRDDYLKKMRVLCLSETHDNVLMWTHYSDQHTGVVIKLKVAEIAEDDDPLWLAQPVNYTSKATPHAGEDFVDQWLGLKKLTIYNPGSYWRWAHEKYEGWKYENEWRVVDPAEEEIPEGYHDGGFKLKSIDSVYFGLRCSQKDMDDIIAVLRIGKPDVKYFKARKHAYAYKLEFDEIAL